MGVKTSRVVHTKCQLSSQEMELWLIQQINEIRVFGYRQTSMGASVLYGCLQTHLCTVHTKNL